MGVTSFVVSCGYLHEVIQDYFGDGSTLGVRFEYAIEHTPLGRGGGLRQGLGRVPSTEPLVIATNADILTDQALAPMISQHRTDGNMATLLLTRYVSQYGIVEVEADKITRFMTNPVLPHWINGGVYVLDRGIIDRLPEVGEHEDSTFPALAGERRLGGFLSEAWWRGMDSMKDRSILDEELRARVDALSG